MDLRLRARARFELWGSSQSVGGGSGGGDSIGGSLRSTLQRCRLLLALRVCGGRGLVDLVTVVRTGA